MSRRTAALAVTDLATELVTKAGPVRAIDQVRFSIDPGQVMGLVGESGSGKTVTAYSLLGLIDPPGRIVEGQVLLNGENLLALAPRQLRHIRGDRISMVFQDPMATLNPVLTIETQLVETILAHQSVTRRQARSRAEEALARVGIASPRERLSAYPHQFSGGMRQRVVIAIAMINRPDVMICDEPTTALDVTVQSQIIDELHQLCRESGTALLWITHDLAVVAGIADSLAVMYAGRLVESGSTRAVLNAPRHPYTAGLIESTPAAAVLRGVKRGEPLAQIPGYAPALGDRLQGCTFRTRCARASGVCESEPIPDSLESGHMVRCFHPLNGAPGAGR